MKSSAGYWHWSGLPGLPVGLVLGCVLVALAGCGFHLRGAYTLPAEMATTQLQAFDDNSELVRSLQRTLAASGIQLVDDREQAGAVLRLFDENHRRRVLSVDSRGRAREYELIYEIRFELTGTASDLQLGPQTLTLRRDFLFDPEDVLGKGREQDTLISDMQQDLVRLIMLRLQAAADKCVPCSAE